MRVVTSGVKRHGRRRIRRAGAVVLVIGAMSAACASTKKGQLPSERPSAEYRIGREDVLEVVVWREPDLSRVVPVRPDGKIALPLVGEVEAAGKTPGELGTSLTETLSPYVRDVSVAVVVREINGPRFFILGEVARPGAYPLRGSLSVVQGLATAGGRTEFAGDRVVWVRQKDQGSDRVSLSYQELVKGEAAGSLWLMPGDVIYVP